jgi:AcrR family transcriptional regulator
VPDDIHLQKTILPIRFPFSAGHMRNAVRPRPSVDAEPPENATEVIDGRRLRGENNRLRISAAFLALIAEGVVTPTAEDVASRAGVGLRSVFRHFTDMEMLYREMAVHSQRLVSRLADISFSETGGQEQLDQIIDARTTVYEEMMPFQIAARVHLHESPYLRLHLESFADFQRAALLDSFPKEWLKDKALLEALNLALSFDTWMRLRRDQRLNRSTARRVMSLTCSALLQGKASVRGS